MLSRQLMRSSSIVAAAVVAIGASLLLAEASLAQSTADTGAVRTGRGGSGGGMGGGGMGRGGNRQPGSGGNSFDGASPEMFEKFMETVLRSERVNLNDEQIAKWRAWNKRFDPERRAIVKEERDARMQSRQFFGPNPIVDEAKSAEVLDRLLKVERRWTDLHERENKDLATFIKLPSQRLRFWAFQDFVRRDIQETQNRRDGGRGNGTGGPGGRGGQQMRGDTTKFRQGMKNDSGPRFQRGGPPRQSGKVDTLLPVDKPPV